jgi:phage tail sheath protein FI
VSNELLASKVVVIEEAPQIRNIPSVATSVAGALGLAERGPLDQAVLVTSPEDYSAVFGGLIPGSDLAFAAQSFFDNGGSTLWVVRTVHHTDPTDSTTKTSKAATLTLADQAPAALPTLRVDGLYDGSYANDIQVSIEAPTSGAPNEFNLVVVEDGSRVEVYPNLTMDPTQASYVVSLVNAASQRIMLTDLKSATAAPRNAPARGAVGPMSGGDDGLTGLADTDFTGSAVGATGLFALNAVQDLDILLVPGRATAAVHNAMVAYCEEVRGGSCFAILDPPEGLSAVEVLAYAQTTAGLLGLSEFGATYWPRVQIQNPNPAVFGSAALLTVPPSGAIAGVYARTDGSQPGGVYIPPAGIENGGLVGVLGFETTEVLDEAKRDLLFPKRINPLSTIAGIRAIDGARTLKGDGNFPTIGERRGVIFIEQSLKQGMAFARHQNNTPGLRAALRRTVTTFLTTQMRNGAFRSTDPKTAFFVDFSDALNPPSIVFSGQVVGRIGLATNKPAEFIVLRVVQNTADLAAETGA